MSMVTMMTTMITNNNNNNNNSNLYSAGIRHVVTLMALLNIKHLVKTIPLMPIKRPFLDSKHKK